MTHQTSPLNRLGTQPRRRRLVSGWRPLVLVLLALAGPARAAETPDPSPTYQIQPIGHIAKEGDKTLIVLEDGYARGLLRLDDFSHLWVIWWFDRNDTPERREILQVHPRRDSRNPLSGVFATRAPVRPNLIGLSLCRIIAVSGNRVEIDGIDAYAGTPVLDLKPYLPDSESLPDAKAPERY